MKLKIIYWINEKHVEKYYNNEEEAFTDMGAKLKDGFTVLFVQKIEG